MMAQLQHLPSLRRFIPVLSPSHFVRWEQSSAYLGERLYFEFKTPRVSQIRRDLDGLAGRRLIANHYDELFENRDPERWR